MSQANLNQILDQLPNLEQSELQYLSQAIHSYLSEKETVAKKSVFHQSLIESGLVKQIKKPAFASRTHQQLIPIQGKPVSQTIIVERR